MVTEAKLSKAFKEVTKDYIADKPQGDLIRWTGLKPTEIQAKLAGQGYTVSVYIIKQMLADAGLKRRSYLKDASAKEVPYRNEQFEKIAHLKGFIFRCRLTCV